MFKLKVHYEGLKNLVHHINKKEIELFIHAGSSLEYGNLKSLKRKKIIVHHYLVMENRSTMDQNIY